MQTIFDVLLADVMPAIFSLVGTICALLLTKKVIPYIASKLGKDELETIQVWIETLVWSAQRLYESGALRVPKKEYVMQEIVQFAADHGIKLTEAQLDQLRRAAVKQLEVIEAQIKEALKDSAGLSPEAKS